MRQDLHQETAFLALADALSDLVALIQDGKVRYLNAAGGRLLGESASGLAALAGKPGRSTQRLRGENGGDLWIELSVDDFRIDGKPALLVTGHDVTEAKKTEEALRKSEARLRGLYTRTPTVMFSVDFDGLYREVSDALLETLGYTREELIGANSRDHLTAESLERLLERNARGVESKDWWTRDFPVQVRRKDGAILDIEFSSVPELDENGEPKGWLCVATDLTERNRTQARLRDRETKLAEAQRVAHVGSWEYDIRSKRSIWSDEMYRIFRLDPLSFDPTAHSAIPRIHPEDVAHAGAAVQETIESGKPYQYEFRIVLDDGEIRSMWTIGRAELGSDGKPSRIYGTVQDVTERKRAEDLLRESEQRFRNLYTQAPVLMTAIDADLRFRDVTNYWLERFGYDRHEVIGRSALEFVAPDHRAKLLEELKSCLAKGEKVIKSRPAFGLRKDGTIVDALVTSFLDIDAQGRFQGGVTVGLDVSHMRRAEEAVRESEARYRALVDHAPEAIAVLDVEAGSFIDMNEGVERMFGYPREKILGSSPIAFAREVQPDGTPSSVVAEREIAKVLAGGTASFEWACIHASGREMMCQVRLSKLPFKDRQLLRSSIEDITELKMLQEKARHDDRMAAIGVLAAGVAHEIGNPLLALSMAAQSLERKISDDYAQKKLGLIREHIDRISRIVRQMSDLARPRVAEKSDCDVNHVVERTLEIVRYDKRAKAVEIRFEPGSDLPWVAGVEDELLQVCLNLGLNALDAVAENPPERPRSLAIATRAVRRGERTFVRATFSDSGPGIPEVARPRVFQPFFTTKAPGLGTGLGLSVSQRIVEEHGGTLGFECAAGGGTEFFFELPVKKERT